jgi:hypothetical protein
MNQWYERLVAPATTAGKWLRAGGALVVVAGVAVLFALTTGVWAKAPQQHQPVTHQQAGGQTTVIYACENNAGKVLSFNTTHQSCAKHTQKVTVTIHYACLDVNSGKLLSFTTASALCSSSAKKVLLTQVGTGSLAPQPVANPSPDASAVPDTSPVVVQPSPIVSHGYGALANNVTLSRKGQSVVAILSLPGGGYAVNAVVQVQTKVAGGSLACSVGSNKRSSGNGLQNSIHLTRGVATLSIVGTIITKGSANLTVNCQPSNASTTVTILHATITVAQIDGVN